MNDDFKRPLGPNPKVKEAQPVESEPPVTMGSPAPVVKEKKKYSKAFSFVSILLLLALLGTGVMTYFWYDAQNRLDDAQTRVASLETDLSAATKPEDQPSEDVISKEDAVISAAKEYAALMQGDYKEYTYEITKSNEEFAVVSFGDESAGVGAKIYLKSAPANAIDGQNWVVVYDGQNVPPQEVVDKFAIPEDF